MAHLVDGDPASNNGGWQWAASTGTDPSHGSGSSTRRSRVAATTRRVPTFAAGCPSFRGSGPGNPRPRPAARPPATRRRSSITPTRERARSACLGGLSRRHADRLLAARPPQRDVVRGGVARAGLRHRGLRIGRGGSAERDRDRIAQSEARSDGARGRRPRSSAPRSRRRGHPSVPRPRPSRRWEVRSEVDDRQPSAAGCRREDQPAQLVVAPGGIPTRIGGRWRLARRPGTQRRAGGGPHGWPGARRRPASSPVRPGVADRPSRAGGPVIGDHALVPSGREHLVEDGLDPWAVEPRGSLDEAPDLGVSRHGLPAHVGVSEDRRVPAGASPRHDRRRSGARCPAVLDQPPHRPQPAERGFVVHAVARPPSARARRSP